MVWIRDPKDSLDCWTRMDDSHLRYIASAVRIDGIARSWAYAIGFAGDCGAPG